MRCGVLAAFAAAATLSVILVRRSDRRSRLRDLLSLLLRRAHSALIAAARAGRVSLVWALLAVGTDVNGADPAAVDAAAGDESMTPLHAAAIGRHVDVVRTLVAGGASPSAVTFRGFSRADLIPKAQHADCRRRGRVAPARSGER